MKRILTIQFLFVISFIANAQNDFAIPTFYNNFKKIAEDAQSGFSEVRGEQRKGGSPELLTEYKLKLMLPLTDSGKLVIPVNGNPYAIFYFEPDKVRLKVDQRATDLREAVTIAYNKPLYIKTETILIDDKPWSNTLYYGDDKMEGAVLFRQSIYFQEGKFQHTLEIKGVKNKK